MPELPLTRANRMLDDSSRLSTGEATRILFDHYRCARPDMQDALVLALIGSVLTSRAMLAVGAYPTRSAAPETSS